MSFGADIAKFSVETPKRIERVRKGVCLRLFNAVIQDTPVDKGLLRGNWQTSTDAPKEGELERFDKDGLLALQEAQGKLGDGTRVDVTVYFVNNLPYAAAMEYGGSDQNNRKGMVRRNVARVNQIINQAIKKGALQV